MRFMAFYELLAVTTFVTRGARSILLHKILLVAVAATGLCFVGLQNYYHPTPATPVFSLGLYSTLVLCMTLASAVSGWVVWSNPTVVSDNAHKWSIPANAIYTGAVGGGCEGLRK